MSMVLGVIFIFFDGMLLYTYKNNVGSSRMGRKRYKKVRRRLVMGTDEIPHINNVNDSIKILIQEVRQLNQTMSEIKNKLDKIQNDTYRIP
jgi:hypothetical protein